MLLTMKISQLYIAHPVYSLREQLNICRCSSCDRKRCERAITFDNCTQRYNLSQGIRQISRRINDFDHAGYCGKWIYWFRDGVGIHCELLTRGFEGASSGLEGIIARGTKHCSMTLLLETTRFSFETKLLIYQSVFLEVRWLWMPYMKYRVNYYGVST